VRKGGWNVGTNWKAIWAPPPSPSQLIYIQFTRENWKKELLEEGKKCVSISYGQG